MPVHCCRGEEKGKHCIGDDRWTRKLQRALNPVLSHAIPAASVSRTVQTVSADRRPAHQGQTTGQLVIRDVTSPARTTACALYPPQFFTRPISPPFYRLVLSIFHRPTEPAVKRHLGRVQVSWNALERCSQARHFCSLASPGLK